MGIFAVFGVVKGFVKLVPPKVWIGLAIVLAIWYYGHWKEKQGVEKCQAAIELRTQQIRGAVDALEVELLQERAETVRIETSLEAKLQEAIRDAQRLENADVVCIPGSITDKLR